MNFFDTADYDDANLQLLASYDTFVQDQISINYQYPIRLREWELLQILRSLKNDVTYERALDTGAVNTFFGLWLTQISKNVIVSDLLFERIYKNILRRLRILPRKTHEANIETWYRAIKSNSKINIKNINLTSIVYPDCHFDIITSVSVIEHIPNVEAAISEMYRCLKVGGKLYITTDCSPAGKPLADGVRYFTPEELESIFSKYPVTSEFRKPDFSEKNWCYDKGQPITLAFIEITKN